jgi:pilus assembly protein CpaF
LSEWRKKDFHVGELDGQEKMTTQPANKKTGSHALSDQFKELCTLVRNAFREKNEKRSDKDMKKWQALQHDAVVGKPEAVQLFMGEIEEYIRNHQLQQVQQPSYYDSLVEAVFQQTFGLGPISVWKKHPKYPKSQSARIMGRKIFFDIPGEQALQPFGYESEEEVIENIIEKIRMKDEFSHINKYNPKLELDLEDGTRVTIMIPPLVRRPTIIFRNYTMRAPTLEDLVGGGTIPAEALPILRGISQSLLNLVISGEVRSGKSTMIKAIYAERRREGRVAVTIERGHSELKLSDIHENDQLVEIVVKTDEEYETVFDIVLRSDYSFVIVGETRSIEGELFLVSCERGKGGSMTSYHTERVANLPGQLARIILQRFPNRQYQEELIRVAENLHIAFVMKECDDGSKLLIRVTEIRLDPYTFEVSCHDIMRWESEQEKWAYCNDLSNDSIRKLKETAPEFAEQALSTLKRLAAEHPMSGSNVEKALGNYSEEEEDQSA